jgi:hypothetical protein
MHGFVSNQKHSLQMALGSSWTKVTSVWGSEGIMLENDSIFVLLYLLQTKGNTRLPLLLEFLHMLYVQFTGCVCACVSPVLQLLICS